jgi:sec-independent protein translocase protein TatC
MSDKEKETSLPDSEHSEQTPAATDPAARDAPEADAGKGKTDADASTEDKAAAGEGGSGTPPPPPPADTPEKDGEEEEEEESSRTQMSFLDHLSELRLRLTRCSIAIGIGFLACYGFSKQLFELLMRPLVEVIPPESKLIFTALPEAFFTYIKVALVGGVLLTSPYIFYQIWRFIAPGLYEEERQNMVPVALCSGLFFVAGSSFGYYVVFPFAFEFFMSFATEVIQPMPSLKEYLSFSLKLLFAFGLVFELPLFIFFLARLGIVNAKMLRKFRKYAFICAFILSAILTPPDVISQTLMAGPLIVLFELSIWVAHFFGRKTRAEREAENKAAAEKEAEEGTEGKADG